MSRLLEEYKNQIRQELKSKLDLKNVFEVPKIEKIILNIGVGEGKERRGGKLFREEEE